MNPEILSGVLGPDGRIPTEATPGRTLIPPANPLPGDGTPQGYSLNKRPVVTVVSWKDKSGHADPPFEVDLSKITKGQSELAARKAAAEAKPGDDMREIAFSAFKNLAAAAAADTVPPTATPAPVPQVPAVAPTPLPFPVFRDPQSGYAVPPSPPPREPIANLSDVQQLMRLLELMKLQQVQPVPAPMPPAVLPSVVAAMPATPATSVAPAPLLGFMGAVPEKPKYEVGVDLGKGGGRFSAYYHAVITGASCVVLVYDTRYEAGFHWAPPRVTDSDFTLLIKGPSFGNSPVSRQVGSLGLEFDLGCLSFVVLPAADDAAAGLPVISEE